MWITLQPNDVLDRLTAPEVAAVQTKALGATQKDPIPEAILAVSEEVRGYVANAERNLPLAGGFNIPFKLRDAALAMIAYRVCTRLPAKSLITDDRRALYKDALRLMEMVAAGKFQIDRPDPSQYDTTENIGAIYPSFNGFCKHRHFRDQTGV